MGTIRRPFHPRRRTSRPARHGRRRSKLQITCDERSEIGHSNLISTLREEILAAISRHVAVEVDKVQVKMDRGPVISTLEIEVEIPNVAEVSRLAANA